MPVLVSSGNNTVSLSSYFLNTISAFTLIPSLVVYNIPIIGPDAQIQ